MTQRQEAIFFSNPEVIAGVILMMMRIDNEIRTKRVQEFQKFLPTKGEACVDQESVNKKGIHLVKGKTQKLTGHSNRIDKTIGFKMDRQSIHALPCLMITPLMIKLTNSLVWFNPNEWSGLFLP